jgi:hypothetical protein
VGDTCVLPHGVTSLAPSDPDFHGRHLDLERYHYDEAYHNGDVWVWLTGPVVSAFVREGLVERAWEQTRVLTDLFYEQGAAGTLPELRNGVPPERGENVGGAVSQAWSLAEFLRTFHQDYLGVAPDLIEGVISLRPALPADLSWIRAPVHLGPGSLDLFYEIDAGGEGGRFRVSAGETLPSLRVLLEVRVPLSGRVRPEAVRSECVLDPGATIEFVVARGADGWTAEAARIGASTNAGGPSR